MFALLFLLDDQELISFPSVGLSFADPYNGIIPLSCLLPKVILKHLVL